MYLLLSFIKFMARNGLSRQQMLRLIQLNLFERRDLIKLLKPDTETMKPKTSNSQLTLI